ncbi:hypothetical protein TNIN_53661 [Trichonephila inaurata madagascariensis]|uniref:Uncharacterized protein n=1 Tax=Trichonephila inaurata madagascariensis TaxID=2747483 RepID=A0A8X6YIH2_9ARAC|nr:hypothetical protein TNIN_53661 [Trichonephila inaurata madagascariensis]
MLGQFLIICYYASLSLEEIKNGIVSATTQEDRKPQPNLADKYSSLIRILKEVQQIFSLASFSLCLEFITSSFTCLSILLLRPDSMLKLHKFESGSMLITNTASLIAMFYFGGRIPLEMTDIRMTFYVKYMEESNRFTHNNSQAKLSSLKKLVDLPEIVLSGCDIVHYTKTNIFSAIGSFITYTLLLLQFNHRNI